MVNLMGGPGESEVFLDDLEIEPVPRSVLAPDPKPEEPEIPAAGRPKSARGDARRKGNGSAPVRLERNLLEKRGRDGLFHPWFPTAIDAPGANPGALRDLAFDVLIDSTKTDPAKLRPAVERRALIMARLSGATAPDAPDRILEEMNAYPLRDSVAFWHLGSQLGSYRVVAARKDELTNVRAAISAVHNLDQDGSRLTLAGVQGDLGLFARAPPGST